MKRQRNHPSAISSAGNGEFPKAQLKERSGSLSPAGTTCPNPGMKHYFVAFGDLGGSATPPLGGSVGCPFGGVATPPFWPPAPAAGEAAPAFWTFTISDCSPVTGVGATDDAATTFVPKMSKTPAVACFASMSYSFLLVGPCGPGQRCKQAISWQQFDLRCFFESSCDEWAPTVRLRLPLSALGGSTVDGGPTRRGQSEVLAIPQSPTHI
jgi:hypothetical protein